MSDRGLGIYLNDHLAGATFGSALAREIRTRNQDTALGELMRSIAPAIEEDRQALVALMALLRISRNPLKRATTWAAEKASRLKFLGLTSGDGAHADFVALETLSLGVEGKLSLWIALREVAGEHPPLARAPLDELIERARYQRGALERERVLASRRALGSDAPSPG
jgi:hypothetical protein